MLRAGAEWEDGKQPAQNGPPASILCAPFDGVSQLCKGGEEEVVFFVESNKSSSSDRYICHGRVDMPLFYRVDLQEKYGAIDRRSKPNT
jgi:hypothetical protein